MYAVPARQQPVRMEVVADAADDTRDLPICEKTPQALAIIGPTDTIATDTDIVDRKSIHQKSFEDATATKRRVGDSHS